MRPEKRQGCQDVLCAMRIVGLIIGKKIWTGLIILRPGWTALEGIDQEKRPAAVYDLLRHRRFPREIDSQRMHEKNGISLSRCPIRLHPIVFSSAAQNQVAGFGPALYLGRPLRSERVTNLLSQLVQIGRF